MEKQSQKGKSLVVQKHKITKLRSVTKGNEVRGGGLLFEPVLLLAL